MKCKCCSWSVGHDTMTPTVAVGDGNNLAIRPPCHSFHIDTFWGRWKSPNFLPCESMKSHLSCSQTNELTINFGAPLSFRELLPSSEDSTYLKLYSIYPLWYNHLIKADLSWARDESCTHWSPYSQIGDYYQPKTPLMACHHQIVMYKSLHQHQKVTSSHFQHEVGTDITISKIMKRPQFTTWHALKDVADKVQWSASSLLWFF
jgi:hypothetical protein